MLPPPTDAAQEAPHFPFGCWRGTLPLFVAFALLLALILWYAFGRPDETSTSRWDFDRRHWATIREYRYGMIDDLLDDYLEVGMPRTAVLELLGPPDHTSQDAALASTADTRRLDDYELVPPVGFYGDHPRFLRVEYEQDRATKFENWYGS